MQEILEKLTELKSIKKHLQQIGAYNPATMDTDRLLENNIQQLEYILEKHYNIKIYKCKEVK